MSPEHVILGISITICNGWKVSLRERADGLCIKGKYIILDIYREMGM